MLFINVCYCYFMKINRTWTWEDDNLIEKTEEILFKNFNIKIKWQW